MLLDRLNWRYATKKMDPSRAVPQEKLDAILEAIRLAPTSSGLQPFQVFVISDDEVRAKLRGAAFEQSQVTDGSHVLVFAAWDNYTNERIDGVVDLMAAERGGKTDTLVGYYERLKGMYLSRPANVNFEHAARQAYIALGLGLTSAAFEEVDATPMEGFDNAQVDEILGLADKGLKSVAIMALGYRDTTGDWLAPLKKVRRAREDLFKSVA